MTFTETDQELIDDAVGLDDAVNNVECFGSKDVMRLEAILAELERRGYTYTRQLVVTKEEEEDADN